MYQKLTERVGVVAGGTNVGIIRIDDRNVILVDTGLNDTTARKVLRTVRDELGSEVAAILVTHGHADHFGANTFVVKRTSARVYAPDIEEQVLRYPLMQAIMLYGGADPVDPLRTKFLVAEAGPVDEVVRAGRIEVAGVEVEAVALPGHSINQLGYVIDGVFFCADVVFPQAALEKYPIPYLYGLTEHLASLNSASSIEAEVVVPGHGPVEEFLAEPVVRNQRVIQRVLDVIPGLANEPLSTDDLAASVFNTLDVPVNDASGYFLLRPTVSAYLTHLQRQGVLELLIERKGAYWRRT